MKQFRPCLDYRHFFSLLRLPCGGTGAGGCTNPTGNEGDIRYRVDYHTMTFCDGTQWWSMKSGGGSTVGGLTLISTQTASNSASLQWTGLTGNNYLLIVQNIVPATESDNLGLVFGTGGGPTWQTSNYVSSDGGTTGQFPRNAIYLGKSVEYTNTGVSGSVTLPGLNSGATAWITGETMFQGSAGTSHLYTVGGAGPASGTAIKLRFDSGNIVSGSASLYLLN